MGQRGGTMKHLWWWLLRCRPLFGLPGAAGLVLLAIGLPLALSQIPNLQSEQLDLHQQQTAVKEKSRPVVTELPLAERVQQFSASFVPTTQAPEVLANLQKLAKAEGLALPRGQYRIVAPQQGDMPLLRYQLSLPLSGSYAAIRQFVDRARRQIPGLMVDNISFARETVSQPTVIVQLELVVLMREGEL